MNFTPITITLPHADWTYVVGALMKQPMAEVENLVNEMRRQADAQTKPKEEPDGRSADNAAA
jgi:hypothetical protein